MVVYSFVQNLGEAKAWDGGQDCCPQADVGENGEYNHCGSALGGEVPQGLYRSPVVEGTRASSVK